VSRALRTWGPALFWTLLLFAASSRTTLPVSLAGGTDKLAHFAAYTVLGFLLTRAWDRSRGPVWGAIPMGWLIGALDEAYQGTVPGRSPELGDWIADALGVSAGFVLYLLIFRTTTRRETPAARRTQPQDG
jgi:VanZ family protein